MNLKKHTIVVLSVLALFIVCCSGCSKKGTAEKAGEKIDQTVDALKDKFHEATK